MADERWIWWEVENEEEVNAKITASTIAIRNQTRALLDALANDGERLLGKNVPQDTFYSTGYTLRHVDRSDVDWKPGGAGGGGEYEAVVGVKAGASYHPVYVNRGTGVFGPYIKRPYTALNGGKLYFFAERYGRVIGVESVKGQRAQHYLYITFKELQVFAQARVLTGAF